jgi:hypothetical protein
MKVPPWPRYNGRSGSREAHQTVTEVLSEMEEASIVDVRGT